MFNTVNWNGYTPKIHNYNNLSDNDIILIANNFPETVNYVFYHIGLGSITMVQYTICVYLQETIENPNIIIEQFRGIGKSLITSIFVMWLLLKNRELKILIISGTSAKAKNFVRFCYLIMRKVPLFDSLQIPKAKGERVSVESFDVFGASPSQDPSVKSLGIKGTITSARANVIIADDIETKLNSINPSGRELLIEITTEFEALLTAGAMQGVIFLGTRHHRESLYHFIRKERGFKHIICPVIYPHRDDLEGYKGLLAPHVYNNLKLDSSLHGEPMDERFNYEEVQKKRLGMGKRAFDMQMMLTVEASKDAFPLALSDLYVSHFPIGHGIRNMELVGDHVGTIAIKGIREDDYCNYIVKTGEIYPCETIVMHIDPSGRGEDLTAYTVLGSVMGKYFVHQCKGVEGGYSDSAIDFLIDEALAYKVNKVVCEDNFGDGMFTSIMSKRMHERNVRVSIEGIKVYNNKNLRILEAIEPILSVNKLIVHIRVVEDNNAIYDALGGEYSLFTQMSTIIKDVKMVHEDSLDSLGACIMEIPSVASVSEEIANNQRALSDRLAFVRSLTANKYPNKKMNSTDNY